MSTKKAHSVPVTQDEGVCAGQPRITGARLKVRQIALEHERWGWAADQICDARPGVTLAQVYVALSYYYDHREEIDRSIKDDKVFAERLRS